MVELDFVLLDGEPSLREVVDAVLTSTERDDGDLYTRYVLVRDGEGYCGISLHALSTALADDGWTLDTPLASFALSNCEVVPVDAVSQRRLRKARQPLVVAKASGKPVALYQGLTMRGRGRPYRVGWWRLVGKRMAEQDRRLAWPDPLPVQFAYAPVIAIDTGTTLDDVARCLYDAEVAAYLTGRDERGTWGVYAGSEFLDLLTSDYPDADPSLKVEALVRPHLVPLEILERSETPWELVAERVAKSQSRLMRFLVMERGRPAHVLTWQSAVRYGLVEPLTAEGNEQWARYLGTVPEAERVSDPPRVMNAWFADRQREAIPHTHALAANQLYCLGVNLGAASARAHVVGEQPVLDASLMQHVAREGKVLTLRLDSEDFTLVDREQRIRLPRSGDTPDVYLRVATPVATGLSRLRLALYYENNLLQSYLICAYVAPQAGEMPVHTVDGWWAQCEYTLSADLANFDDLGSRRVSLWFGEGKEGVQRGGIRGLGGMDLGPELAIHPSLISGALARYRELLLNACLEDPQSARPEYRYREDHAPHDPRAFEQALVDLAELGQMLYERVFGVAEGWQVAERLREIERAQEGPLVVQIARLSLDATFPWAVLYDRPLRYNPRRNGVCARFVEGDCRANCPYDRDPNVVCPFGFWGFRYIIEQPLRPPGAFASISTRLPAETRPRVALVYGPGLGLAARHRQQIASILGAQAEQAVHDSTEGLLRELAEIPSIVYFYCHGGNTAYRQWLVVREDDPLMPAHLGDDLRSAWANGGPLVVLNGCHTGKYDPATLLSFVHRFGALGAAGVIGTEIPIHEYLGEAFGRVLFRRLLAGDPVGRIVYDFRHELLRRRNPLGLAYVPYCYADLRLAQN
ncbi:MAG: CHAT domain-containing protein [Anaerolineae bacterium]